MGDSGDPDVSVAVSGVGGRGEFGGGGVLQASRAAAVALAVTRGLWMMCSRIEGGRGRLGASMSSELNRRVGVVVRGKTGSARLCLRLRRPPPPLSPSPPAPAPSAQTAPPIINPVPALPLPPPPVVTGIPPPLRRPTKAGTLMRNREFREADGLPVGNGLSAGCGARNGTSGDDPRGEMGDMGESGGDGIGEMDITPLYPLEGAASGVAELIEGEIGISKMDEANLNAGGRRG
jgi:hypothetical protein